MTNFEEVYREIEDVKTMVENLKGYSKMLDYQVREALRALDGAGQIAQSIVEQQRRRAQRRAQ